MALLCKGLVLLFLRIINDLHYKGSILWWWRQGCAALNNPVCGTAGNLPHGEHEGVHAVGEQR